MIGAGTAQDPRRPLFAPLSGRGELRPDGITGFQYQVSDDGRFALVVFQARTQRPFASILNAGRADVRAWIAGRTPRAAVEAELRFYRRNFDLDSLLGGLR